MSFAAHTCTRLRLSVPAVKLQDENSSKFPQETKKMENRSHKEEKRMSSHGKNRNVIEVRVLVNEFD